MWSLHTVTQETRTILKWAAIGIVVVVVIVFLSRGIIALKNRFFPEPPIPPSVGFGKLPPFELPQNVVSGDFTYTLDTISGFLPAFADRGTVYKTVSKTTSLLDLDRAREKVSRMNFDLKTPGKVIEKSLSPVQYSWTETDGALRSITMNTLTNTFSLVSPFLSDPLLTDSPLTFTEEQAKENAQKFFNNSELLPSSIDPELTKTTLLSVSNKTLIPAKKLETAQLIRVDFYQANRDDLPFVYSYPPKTNISTLIDGGSFQGQIVQANYFYQALSDTSETYPIKTSSEAFEELKQGKAYVASYSGTNNTIKIKTVFLAYFLPNTESEYIYPVIVFTGPDDFIAYLPAITSTWYQ